MVIAVLTDCHNSVDCEVGDHHSLVGHELGLVALCRPEYECSGLLSTKALRLAQEKSALAETSSLRPFGLWTRRDNHQSPYSHRPLL